LSETFESLAETFKLLAGSFGSSVVGSSVVGSSYFDIR
jgi:hypothetical protein